MEVFFYFWLILGSKFQFLPHPQGIDRQICTLKSNFAELSSKIRIPFSKNQLNAIGIGESNS